MEEISSDDDEDGELVPIEPTVEVVQKKQEIQAAKKAVDAQVSREKHSFKYVDGKKQEIIEEFIGPVPKGGFIGGMDSTGDDYE